MDMGYESFSCITSYSYVVYHFLAIIQDVDLMIHIFYKTDSIFISMQLIVIAMW